MVLFCKPRVCGEKRLCAPPIASAVGSPPRMRGKDFWHYADNYATGITPAYAGKRRCKAAFCAWFWDHPRMCGEKYLRIAVFVLLLGSPPHVRGKASFFGCSRPGDGITPAYAGKSCICLARLLPTWDHPRVCGEKYTYQRKFFHKEGSPPRMRGKVSSGICHVSYCGITPAYAGKSCAVHYFTMSPQDHPRVCGEKTKKIP